MNSRMIPTGKNKNLERSSRSPSKALFVLGFASVVATLAFVGCVSSSDSVESLELSEEMSDVTEEQLYGDLESGLDSPMWSEEERDASNVIDQALSQSPYSDFADFENPAQSGGGKSRASDSALKFNKKSPQKLGEMSKKGNRKSGERVVKEAAKKKKNK